MSARSSLTDWNTIDWKQLHKYVWRLQQRIYRAESERKGRKVRSLQRLLIRSEASLLLSIRRITQINKGKRTAGVDGYKAITSKKRLELYNQMKSMKIMNHNPSPALRKFIPKGLKGKKLRPLGIPVIKDRIYQNIVKLALEPQWEARFESCTYGFRPKRSTHDAIEAIFNKMQPKTKKKWIFEGDFKGCFDNLKHDYILKKMVKFPARKLVEKWLKAGFIDNHVFHETKYGTPQGGTISPLLANIALHGMEKEIGVKYRSKKNHKTNIIYHEIFDTKSVVIYADDFVILCETKEEANNMYEKLSPYLKERGLELSEEKTKISHITEGFDFLGFHIRQYPVTFRGKPEYKLLIKPSKKSIKKCRAKIRDCFKKCQGTNVGILIKEINPIIRGYGNYWCHVVSKKIFSSIDSYIFFKVRKFLKRMHSNKPRKWIDAKYFHKDIYGISKDRWLLTAPDKCGQIIRMAWTPIERHEIIKYKSTPYDKTLENYYFNRDKKEFYINNVKSKQKLAKLQNYKCLICNSSIVDGEEGLEVHHKIPKCQGGKNVYSNLSLVHVSCHIDWHRTFPTRKSIPTEIQMKAFRRMMKRKRQALMR
jgi:RNA-directed DNA polymerase